MQNLTSQCFRDAYKHLGKDTRLYDGLCAENSGGREAGKMVANPRHETLASHLTARDTHTLYPFWIAKNTWKKMILLSAVILYTK